MAQTGRLGCRGNATGASTKYEGQSKPWHRPKGAETLGIIAGHRGWTTAELDEGEMGGEEAQPPPVFQATGPTSQLGGAGTDGAVPRALRARGSWRQVGGGGTVPEGPGLNVADLGKFAAIVRVFDGVVRGHSAPGGCSCCRCSR